MYEDPYDVPLSGSVRAIPTSTLSVLLFFSTNALLFIPAFLRYKFASTTTEKNSSATSEPPSLSKPSTRIESVKLTWESLYALSQDIFVFGAILLYIWACENRPLFEHGEKWHSLDLFWFLTFALLLLGVATLKEDHKPTGDLLNRDQTEEWKGWMQVMFLLYHYFHINEVYNAVRVMISCYVWMTGFGNFSFFYIKRDFNFVRFYQMMWRLNFLVFFLCMALNNLYILYYICPLHTFYFLLTYAAMAVHKKVNHSKYPMRVKMFVVGLIIYCIWEFPEVFDIAFFFLSEKGHEGYAVGRYGVKYEWHFRSGLDHYSTFFGMIFALNFPQATLWLKQVEQLPVLQQLVAKGGTALVLVLLSVWYWKNIFFLPKLEYNALHPYVFIIPLTTYIFLRNISKSFRTHHMMVLEQIGKVTLETYLMQHHIWLTSNAKSLLVFVPGYPIVNFMVVTTIYFLTSRRLYRLTINLRARCIPETTSGALLSLAVIVALASSYGLLAWLLQAIDVTWTVCGLLLIALAVLSNVGLTVLVRVGASETSASMTRMIGFGKTGFYVLSVGVFTLFLFLTSTFNVSDIEASEIGPLRPNLETYKRLHNNDQKCLKYTNSFEFFDYEYGQLSSYRDIFVSDKKYFSFTPLTARLDEEDTSFLASCRIYVHSNKEIQDLVRNKLLVFVGDENVYRVLLALLVELNPAFVAEVAPIPDVWTNNPMLESMLLKTFQGNKTELPFKKKFIRNTPDNNVDKLDVDFLYMNSEDIVEIASLLDNLDYIKTTFYPDYTVFGGWFENAIGKVNSVQVPSTPNFADNNPQKFSQTSKLNAEEYLNQILEIVSVHKDKNLVYVTPPSVSKFSKELSVDLQQVAKDYFSKVMKRLNVPEFNSKPVGVLNLFKLTDPEVLTSFNGVVYGTKLYELAVQILANNYEILERNQESFPPPNRLLSPGTVDANESAKHLSSGIEGPPRWLSGTKGSGGGVAHSPLYGFLILLLASAMLIGFDNYFGLANFFKRLSGDGQRITWEESVKRLHQQLGIYSGGSTKQTEIELGKLKRIVENEYDEELDDEADSLLKPNGTKRVSAT